MVVWTVIVWLKVDIAVAVSVVVEVSVVVIVLGSSFTLSASKGPTPRLGLLRGKESRGCAVGQGVLVVVMSGQKGRLKRGIFGWIF